MPSKKSKKSSKKKVAKKSNKTPSSKKTVKTSKKTSRKISTKEQERLLHDLVEELAGAESGRIVGILFGKKDVNEFSIAKKMELTINQVRNILYKLSAEGLVSFIRKKDKRKGWYIYYWTLNTEKCLIQIQQSLERRIQQFKGLLEGREKGRYYICPSCQIEVGEETALEHGFTCEECAEVYELVDNTPFIRDLKSKITRKENDLGLIMEELENHQKKLKVKRKRKETREKNKVKKEKAKKRASKKKVAKEKNIEKKKKATKSKKKMAKVLKSVKSAKKKKKATKSKKKSKKKVAKKKKK